MLQSIEQLLSHTQHTNLTPFQWRRFFIIFPFFFLALSFSLTFLLSLYLPFSAFLLATHIYLSNENKFNGILSTCRF